uniref:C2H2-type domain-containing protein n=1 Tax=Pundamilia nyererei TaxID=303518 RepID=A0A3B4H672_9CICH
MTRHLRNQHGAGQHVCTACGITLESFAELKSHKRKHKSDVLSYPECREKLSNSDVFSSHVESDSKSFSTHTEGQSSQQIERVEVKIEEITSDDSAFGNRDFQDTGSKANVLMEEGNSDEAPSQDEGRPKENPTATAKTKGHFCPVCINRRFRGPNKLMRHMRTHTKEKPFSCPVCAMTFSQSYHMTRHQSHGSEQYYCALCRKHFLKRESKCPHCDTVFLQLTALKYHLRTHTEERPYQCTCCIETFEEREDLEHSHEGEQPQTCSVCGRTFLNKNKLEKHLTIHTGERPHLCSICGNGFPSAASLKLHVHIHTGEKPYQCSQCSKSFRSSSGLRLHSRQHMEVRPSYECPQCGRTYGRMTELKMHQRYHTGDKPYACTCCSKHLLVLNWRFL